MEQVFVIAVKSFINGVAGSVTKKQRLLLPKNIASEFVSMGLVKYESESNQPVKKQSISNLSQETVTDGLEKQSASSQVGTASPNPKSQKRKLGRPTRTGK